MHHRQPRKTDALFGLALAVLLAGVAAAEEAKAPAAAPIKLKINWSTSSEVDNYGFWVMRGDTKDGPFKEANAKLIPGAGNSDLPRKYSFEDLNVEMGKTYYYFLDALSTKGVREKYSPVMAKQCCDTVDSKAPEAQEIKPEEGKPEEHKHPPAPPAPPTPPSS